MNPDREKSKYNAMDGFVKKEPVYQHRNTPEVNHKKIEKVEEDYLKKEEIIEDQKTKNAIDDIVLSESNSLMQIEDKNIDSIRRGGKKQKSKLVRILFNKWNFIVLGLILITLFGLPYTRYKILGLYFKNDVTIQAIDSDTKNGISGAVVRVDNKNYKTDVNGIVDIKLNLGSHSFSFNKPYYGLVRRNLFVGFNKKPILVVNLNSTGRSLSVEVVNKFNSKPISGAVITILGSDYITDSKGKVRMILSTSSESYPATITAKSYVNTTATIIQSINGAMNVITMVPNGNIFYLTNQNNKLNLMKSNLDGSSPSVVVVPTGKENISTSHIYQSLDNKYLILFTNRGGTNNQLYSVSVNTAQLNEFDNGSDKITPIGWVGDYFYYDSISSSLSNASAGYEQIKMYNAATSKVSVMDQNNVETTSDKIYAYQGFVNFTLLYNQLVYTTKWIGVGGYDISTQNDTIRGLMPSFTKPQDYYSFNAHTSEYIKFNKFTTNSIYIQVFNAETTPQTYEYYTYTNGSVISSKIDAATFNSVSPAYYYSLGASQTFWNSAGSIYEGDNLAQNAKKLNYDGYNFYAWFNTEYILITKGDVLYLTPINGSKVYQIGSAIF